jgi:hypothetical protein
MNLASAPWGSGSPDRSAIFSQPANAGIVDLSPVTVFKAEIGEPSLVCHTI